MADMLKLPNNKRGFITLLIMEALAAAWALAATFYAAGTGSTRTVVFGAITVFALFYILGRSLRGFRNIVRQERKEGAAAKKETKE